MKNVLIIAGVSAAVVLIFAVVDKQMKKKGKGIFA